MDQVYRREQLIYSNQTNRVEVYKVFDTSKNVHAILKIISTYRPEEAKAIKDEAYAQASLAHSNICQVFNYFEELCAGQMKCCIVLEFLDSDLMKDLVNRRKQTFPYTELELWTILSQVSSALAYAKSMGVAHRDIKPANILLSNKKECKVADFGTVKSVGEMIGNYSVVGTPLYLSPQVRQGMVNFRDVTLYNPYAADVYSLGITMIYLAMLESPIKLNVLDSLEEKIEAEIQQIQTYSEDFKQMLRAMLRVREEDRISIEQIEAWCQAKVSAASPQYYSQTVPVVSTYVHENRAAGQYEQPQALPPNPSYLSGYQNAQQPMSVLSYASHSSVPSVSAQAPSSIQQQRSLTVDRHKLTHCANCRNNMKTNEWDRIRLPCGGIVCCSGCFRRLIQPNCPTCHAYFDPMKYQF